ncbi:MAG TPA: type II toxin-antitoxin system RelE/ParE family toxin [Acidobacteriaceae bacterium]
MPRLSWSPRALRDLHRLHDFLAPKSQEVAGRAVLSIRNGIRMLAKHPEIGRPIDGMLPEFRELVIEFGHGGYVARYHFDGRRTVVLAIRHGREAGY